MSAHIPTFVMLGALAMLLTAIVVLVLNGQKPDSPVLLGLVAAASGMAGTIGGFSMHSPPPKV